MNYLPLARTWVHTQFVGGVCVVFNCFVCLSHVSYVPNVACVSGLSILDCSFRFL